MPIKTYIDNLPYIVGNVWLYTILFSLMFYIFLNFISLFIGHYLGVQPFEILASYIDSKKIFPNLSSYINRRLMKSLPNSYDLNYRVRLIEKAELDEFNLLNREIFHFTAFGLPLNVIKKRNNDLFNVNRSSFAFIEANFNGVFIPIGISHIVPLNDLGKSLYIRNKGIRDSDIGPEHISKDNEWSNAIVLFSMGLVPALRSRLKDSSLTIVYVFAEHLIYILQELPRENKKTTLIAQTEKPHGGLVRLLSHLGFEKTGIISGDGYIFWERTVQLPTIVQELEDTFLSKEFLKLELDKMLTNLIEKQWKI